MHKQIKDKWTTALKGGEYEQSRGHLKTFLGYCPLGVLCDIVKNDVGGEWHVWGTSPMIDDPSNLPQRFIINGSVDVSSPSSSFSPPTAVLEYAGMSVDKNDDVISKLIVMNDDEGRTFGEIADFIEESC